MNRNLLIVAFALIGLASKPLRAEVESYACQGPVVLPSPPLKFRSSTLEGQVDESVEQVKQGILGYITELMNRHQKEPDKVLSLFERYINDPDDDARFAVVIAASHVRTKKSMQVLTIMVTDHDVGNDAIGALYSGYSRNQIVTGGGTKLRVALVRSFVSDRYSTDSALLLSLFGRRKSTIDLLKQRRSSYKDDKYAPQIVCINLALSNMGNMGAQSEIMDDFARNHVQHLLTILRQLKFVENRAVLSHAVSLLKNKSNATETGFPGGPPQYTRLCDEAMVALQSRFEKGGRSSYRTAPRFTDAELLAAYNKYSALLAAKAPTKRVIQQQLAQPSR